MKKIKYKTREIIASPSQSLKEDPLSINSTLKKLITSEKIKKMTILDVGCGRGRLMFNIAPYAKKVVGIDLSKKEIDAAKKYKAANSINNVQFIHGDAEKVDYLSLTNELDMVMSNLCMSDIIIKRSYDALQKRRCLIFTAFHIDQWKETKKISPFSYDEDYMKKVLFDTGFEIEHITVEKEIVKFKNLKDALDFFQKNKKLMEKFKTDERWQNMMGYLQEGGRSFTYKSHFIIKARK